MKSKYDSSIEEVLKDQEWESIIPPVLKYAKAQSDKFKWLGCTVDPDDLVQEAIARAFGIGENETFRNWNKEKCPELINFLIGIIRSITSHKYAHTKSFPKDSFLKEDNEENKIDVRGDLRGPADVFMSKNPEQIYIECKDFNTLINDLKNIAKDDFELEILICFEKGISKPMEIAKETGYNIKEVTKILNRLRARLRKKRNIQNSKLRKVGEICLLLMTLFL